MNRQHFNLVRLFALVILLIAALTILWHAPVRAARASATPTASGTPTARPSPVPATPSPSPSPGGTPAVPVIDNPDQKCLMCHSDPQFKATFANGDRLPMNIDLRAYRDSVHTKAGLQCSACHPGNVAYPHEWAQVGCKTCHPGESGSPQDYKALDVQIDAPSKRVFVLKVNDTCRKCHENEFDETIDSAHAKVMAAGNEFAPTCVDCHGGHDVTPPDQPRDKISRMCGDCHRSVYTTYRSSVHGAALEEDGNPDVPTCIECHGVHSVRGPRNPTFRNDTPAACARCHANQSVMARYGISTDVFQTYQDDFHGETVDLFRRQNSNLPSNKAVCYDCHGIHNVRRVDDPKSSVARENLLNTCRQCHAEANLRFPTTWTSHFLPTWQHNPVLFVVNRLYPAFVALVLGGFVIYIALDAQRRWRDAREGGSHAP